MDALQFIPIGTISSCYKEKFGIPRQPNLVPAARAELILNKEFGEESVRGLAGFSHLWINFIFHATQAQGWKPMVRPPRLGGNDKVGVFASRSTFRPNPLGLSVVKLLEIDTNASQIRLLIGGCDLLDGTPVLDIKPYLPYADSIAGAKGGFAEDKPEVLLDVAFSEDALLQIEQCSNSLEVGGCTSTPLSNYAPTTLNNHALTPSALKTLIIQILQQDPRPSYQQSGNSLESDRIYAMKLYNFDLKWRYCDNNKINVLALI